MKSWLREPLVHFLAIGTVLFLVQAWRGNSGADRIVVTAGQLTSLTSAFDASWQRRPTEEELKGLLDERIRDEIAVREAVALGLDRDDTVIRRRLRQKLEFIVEGEVDATPLDDSELQTYLEQHTDKYRREPVVTFRQVYLDPSRRRTTLDEDGTALLARLSVEGGRADVSHAGDPLMVPVDMQRAPRSSVVRLFGDAFADAVIAAPVGRWSGPIASGFGVHVVYVVERVEAHAAQLQDVRADVERDVRAALRRQRLDDMYAELLPRYRVTVENRSTPGESAGKLTASNDAVRR